VLAVLVGAGLGEDLEVDEAEGHEAEGEARHEAREEHEHDDDDDVLEEGRRAAVVLHRHPPPPPFRRAIPAPLFSPPASTARVTTTTRSFSRPLLARARPTTSSDSGVPFLILGARAWVSAAQ
jgi:hypothetical protein